MNMILEITLRLFVALILGGIIGIEREYRSKEAGFRTHFLVALGSALFCIVSQYGFGFDLKDSSRVAAQVVSGIGFLGAGTIIFQKNSTAFLPFSTRAEIVFSARICYTNKVCMLVCDRGRKCGTEYVNEADPDAVTTDDAVDGDSADGLSGAA